jgi:hypothetical protein
MWDIRLGAIDQPANLDAGIATSIETVDLFLQFYRPVDSNRDRHARSLFDRCGKEESSSPDVLF